MRVKPVSLLNSISRSSNYFQVSGSKAKVQAALYLHILPYGIKDN